MATGFDKCRARVQEVVDVVYVFKHLTGYYYIKRATCKNGEALKTLKHGTHICEHQHMCVEYKRI